MQIVVLRGVSKRVRLLLEGDGDAVCGAALGQRRLICSLRALLWLRCEIDLALS